MAGISFWCQVRGRICAGLTHSLTHPLNSTHLNSTHKSIVPPPLPVGEDTQYTAEPLDLGRVHNKHPIITQHIQMGPPSPRSEFKFNEPSNQGSQEAVDYRLAWPGLANRNQAFLCPGSWAGHPLGHCPHLTLAW